MNILKSLIFGSLLITPLAYADVSCDILEQGNKYYSSRNYREALDIYKKIEDIDRYGKQDCTKSIYATIGTIYNILGDQQARVDPSKASFYHKESSKYNRAFAYAEACNAGNCENSKKFWTENK